MAGCLDSCDPVIRKFKLFKKYSAGQINFILQSYSRLLHETFLMILSQKAGIMYVGI